MPPFSSGTASTSDEKDKSKDNHSQEREGDRQTRTHVNALVEAHVEPHTVKLTQEKCRSGEEDRSKISV